MSVQRASCYPRGTVAVDLAIGLPKTHPAGNVHILVCIDTFSRYTVFIPLKDKTSKAILDGFRSGWVSAFGLPLHIVCDNEAGILGGPFGEFAETFGVTFNAITPYNPPANSYAEGAVKLVKNCLRSFCMANNMTKRWDKYLWLIANSCNNLVSRATNQTPDLLMFGHQNINMLQNPITLLKDPARAAKIVPDDVMRTSIATMIKEVNNMRNEQRARNMSYINSKKQPPPFEESQLVLHKRLAKTAARGVPSAFQPRWNGPYVIVALYTTMAQIQHAIYGHIKIALIDHLKPYFSNDFDYDLPKDWDAAINQALEQNAAQISKIWEAKCKLPTENWLSPAQLLIPATGDPG